MISQILAVPDNSNFVGDKCNGHNELCEREAHRKNGNKKGKVLAPPFQVNRIDLTIS
jgi:hypothetical protein